MRGIRHDGIKRTGKGNMVMTPRTTSVLFTEA